MLINDARRQLGLPALERSASLDADARALAASLAARQMLRHRSTKEFHSLSVDWIRVAENVGTGANADEVHRLLMSSPPHRANVLGPYTLVGIGVSRDRRDRLWVTEVFVAR